MIGDFFFASDAAASTLPSLHRTAMMANNNSSWCYANEVFVVWIMVERHNSKRASASSDWSPFIGRLSIHCDALQLESCRG
jgi:hypothetical protein